MAADTTRFADVAARVEWPVIATENIAAPAPEEDTDRLAAIADVYQAALMSSLAYRTRSTGPPTSSPVREWGRPLRAVQ
jgi:hypothetical protein